MHFYFKNSEYSSNKVAFGDRTPNYRRKTTSEAKIFFKCTYFAISSILMNQFVLIMIDLSLRALMRLHSKTFFIQSFNHIHYCIHKEN